MTTSPNPWRIAFLLKESENSCSHEKNSATSYHDSDGIGFQAFCGPPSPWQSSGIPFLERSVFQIELVFTHIPDRRKSPGRQRTCLVQNYPIQCSHGRDELRFVCRFCRLAHDLYGRFDLWENLLLSSPGG